MTNNQITKLLNKKSFTGRQAGKLLMASLLHDIKQLKQGKTPEPLFSQEELRRIEKSLDTAKNNREYAIYTELYGSIVESWNYANTNIYHFLNGYYRLLDNIKELQTTDKAEKSYDDEPYIVTEKQYEDLKERTQKKINASKKSYAEVFMLLIKEVIREIKHKDKPDAPKELVDAVNELKETEETNAEAIYVYNRFKGLGYYTLPSGKRSDQVKTLDEWQEAYIEELSEIYELTINGKKASVRETLEELNVDIRLAKSKAFYNGVDKLKKAIEDTTGQDISINRLRRTLEDPINRYIYNQYYLVESPYQELEDVILKAIGQPILANWSIYKEAQDKITMFDMLELYIYRYLSGDQKESFKALKRDYPELYIAFKVYIEQHIEEAKGLRANQLYNDRWTNKQLAEAGIFKYDLYTTVTDAKITKVIYEDLEEKNKNRTKIDAFFYPITRFSGIALIKDPSYFDLDDNGYYEKERLVLHHRTLELIENKDDLANEIASYIEDNIKPALSSVYAFNELLKIIESVYDIKDLSKIASIDTSEYESRIRAYNKYLYYFYTNVTGSERRKELKRQIIKDTFYDIHLEEIKPTETAISKVKELLSTYGLTDQAKQKYRYLDSYLYMLQGGL